MNEAYIEGFENYVITDEGQIFNQDTGRQLSLRQNKEGITMVNLFRSDKLYTRSVAVLVARHFLDPPPLPSFDTPIHRDGDKRNCFADNLMWRPRWFAVRYHQQFDRDPYYYTSPIICLDLDQVFDSPRAAAVTLGLLEYDIMQSLQSQKGVWPDGLDFRIYKE